MKYPLRRILNKNRKTKKILKSKIFRMKAFSK